MPYNKITKAELNSRLASVNSTAALSEAKLIKTVDSLLFPPGTNKINSLKDTTGKSITLTSAARVLFEFTSAGSNHSVSVGSTGEQNVVVLGQGNVNLKDTGGTGDKGDIIVGGSGKDDISASPNGNDTVYAGGVRAATIMGGGGKDKLYGGGRTEVWAGSGNQSLYGGLNLQATDSLYGSTGKDWMSLKAGHNFVSAGSGLSTIFTGSGHDTVKLIDNGSASVTAGGQLLVDFGGSAGNATIRAGSHHVKIDAIGESIATSKHSHGVTTVHFKDHQILVYTGNSVTLKT